MEQHRCAAVNYKTQNSPHFHNKQLRFPHELLHNYLFICPFWPEPGDLGNPVLFPSCGFEGGQTSGNEGWIAPLCLHWHFHKTLERKHMALGGNAGEEWEGI